MWLTAALQFTVILFFFFFCKEMILLCLINSRRVSASLIITKWFRIQVALFNLVRTTLSMFVMVNVMLKFFAKLKHLRGKLHFRWVILGHKLMMWPSPQHLSWCGTQKCQSSLLVASPGWKEIKSKTHKEVLLVPQRTFLEAHLNISTYFHWSPLPVRESGKCF